MTRIYVQRGSGSGSSSNTNRSNLSGSLNRQEAQASSTATPVTRDEETLIVVQEPTFINNLVDSLDVNQDKVERKDEASIEISPIKSNEGIANDVTESEQVGADISVSQSDVAKGFDGLHISENSASQKEQLDDESSQVGYEGPNPPPPPTPPPNLVATSMSSRKVTSSSSNAMRIGSSKRTWPVGPAMSSPSHSRPSSPHSHGESEGYNSADEHNPGFISSYNDIVSFIC